MSPCPARAAAGRAPYTAERPRPRSACGAVGRPRTPHAPRAPPPKPWTPAGGAAASSEPACKPGRLLSELSPRSTARARVGGARPADRAQGRGTPGALHAAPPARAARPGTRPSTALRPPINAGLGLPRPLPRPAFGEGPGGDRGSGSSPTWRGRGAAGQRPGPTPGRAVKTFMHRGSPLPPNQPAPTPRPQRPAPRPPRAGAAHTRPRKVPWLDRVPRMAARTPAVPA
jgi:hypothetical protein